MIWIMVLTPCNITCLLGKTFNVFNNANNNVIILVLCSIVKKLI